MPARRLKNSQGSSQPAAYCKRTMTLSVALPVARPPFEVGIPLPHRQKRQLGTPAVEEGVVADEQRVGALALKSCEGRIYFAAGAGADHLDCSPIARAAGSTSRNVDSVAAVLAGLTNTATRVAAGTSSRRSSSCFATGAVAGGHALADAVSPRWIAWPARLIPGIIS